MRVSALVLTLFAASNAFSIAPSGRPSTTRLSYSRPATAYDVLPPKKYVAATSVAQEEKPVDEVRETARALFRVFQLGAKASGNDYPALHHATGWSGDVGSGPTTAYDCLPPKKYKAPVVEKKAKAEKAKDNETARALFRVFQLGDEASGNDYPALSRPTGWAGEVGSGPTTAYEALAPKKWKP